MSNEINEKIIKFLKLVEKDNTLLMYTPKEYINKNFYLYAIKNNNIKLINVPKEYIDKEMCLEAVKSDGYNIQYVPEEFIEQDICMEAVKNKPYALQYIPNEYILDDDIIFTIIKTDISCLKFIPKDLLLIFDKYILKNLLNEILKNESKCDIFEKEFIDTIKSKIPDSNFIDDIF